MSIDRENLIAKIKKLLALAEDGCNENEGIAAALKAQKLIAENNIEDHELQDSANESIEEMLSDPYSGKRWREILGAIIAENFRCKNYIVYRSKSNFTQGKEFQIAFVGYSSDANAALLVFNKLVKVGEYNAKEQSRKAKQIYGTSQGVKNTFLLGFCYGVKLELEKQAQALMIVVPKAVNEYMETTLVPTFTHDTNIGSFEIQNNSLDYSEEGTQAGRDAVRSSRLEGARESFLVEN